MKLKVGKFKPGIRFLGQMFNCSRVLLPVMLAETQDAVTQPYKTADM